jgi:tetratricopeptide (TPR) repeat protein
VPAGESPPPAPRDCFGRDQLVKKVVGLAEKCEPIALIGAGGIGKTSIALTVLHHDRIKERFGENRRFIRCDQFPASRAHFLARLSEVICAGVKNPEDLRSMRTLLSSKEMIIILDNAESILDPQGTNTREIYSLVEELCQFQTICLLITSRITTVPRHCKRPEIPTLSMEAACDIFYGIYGDDRRSNIINDLLHRLDFHALSIILLSTTACHNTWDHDRLAKEWDTQRARVLHTDYSESLAATIELSLTSPTFLSLDSDARDLFGVAAFFPQGIDEKNVEWLFPTISNGKQMFDKFYALSLTYRSHGFITMLAPIRDYLSPQDPRSSPLLCATRDRYFSRLSVDLTPQMPGFEEAQWIVLEDVNIEHLLSVLTSIDQTGGDIWVTCFHFIDHLIWYKPRETILKSKIEILADDHPSKPLCLSRLSWLYHLLGNYTEQKRLLNRTLELERQRGDDFGIAQTLQYLSDVNRNLNLYEEGIRQAKEAQQIFERINDTKEQAWCLNDLASLLLDDEQLDAAENAASRAIELVSEKGEDRLLCIFHRALGNIHQSKGEKEKAIHHFKTALGIASRFNWYNELFWIHDALANLFRLEDEFDDAHAHIELAKSHAVNNPFHLGLTIYMRALVLYGQRRFEDAKSETVRALEIFEKSGAAQDAEACRELLQMVERAIQSPSTSLRSELLQTITHPAPIDTSSSAIKIIPPWRILFKALTMD